MELAVTLTLVAALSWAGASILTRRGLAGAPQESLVFHASFVTVAVNTVLLSVLAVFTVGESTMAAMTVPAVVLFVLGGVTGSLVGRTLLFAGFDRVGAGRTQSMKASAPLFATALAVGLLAEPVSTLELSGTALIVVGIVVLSWDTSAVEVDAGGPLAAARLLAVPAMTAVAYGSTTVIRRVALLAWNTPLVGALVGTATGTVALGAYLLVSGRWRVFRRLDWQTYRWFLAAGVLMTVAWLSLYSALSVGRVVVVSPLKQTIPLFTIVLGAIFFRDLERPTARLVLGGLVVVAGAALLTVG